MRKLMLNLTLFGAVLVGLAATPANAHAQLQGFMQRNYTSSAYAYVPAVYRAYPYAYPGYYYTPAYTSYYYTPAVSSYSYIPGYTGYYPYAAPAAVPAIPTYASPMAIPVVPTEASPVAVVPNPLPAATRSMYYNPSNPASRPATIIVHVPENAVLLVNGKRTRSTSSTRLFYSPPLESGKSYHYDFEARMMDRDGQAVKARKRVEVGGGDRREISIAIPDQDQSSDR